MLNGKSYGAKGYEFPRSGMEKQYGTYPPRTFMPRTTSDLHLEWDVPYEPGTLKAFGFFKGKTITEEARRQLWSMYSADNCWLYFDKTP